MDKQTVRIKATFEEDLKIAVNTKSPS